MRLRVAAVLERALEGPVASLFWWYIGYCPPISNSWIIIVIWLYIALNRTLNIDCYWGGGGGSTQAVHELESEVIKGCLYWGLL